MANKEPKPAKLIAVEGDVFKLRDARPGRPVYVLVTDVKGDFIHYLWARPTGSYFHPSPDAQLTLTTRGELDALFDLHQKGALRQRREAQVAERKVQKMTQKA